MLLLKKQDIKVTKKEHEEICNIFKGLGEGLNILGKNEIGNSLKFAGVVTSIIKNIFTKLTNKIDYGIYYCKKKDFNFLKRRGYIEYKNIFKDVYIIKAKHNKKEKQEQLNTILEKKNKFTKVI
ncbi:hypothetical protein [Clostridium cochlearium]|uniref:Uncharacterized protein n=1 Tax=Clostridium cochlearium TaxID=1494 RepID=A0A2X2Y5Y2_CLOCO|nr:hypothetical protein [Clostridium cochlearium]NOH14888.1 hypothetical protein [Clostridium cochlearium]SQB33379.1 Uncharacterised protein [Clostridium cochlearium]SQB33631.1 Uncharacterised protein [Clostridium cochlearium]